MPKPVSRSLETPPHAPRASRLHENLNQHDGKARNSNQERLRELNSEHGDEVTLVCSHDPQMMLGDGRHGSAEGR